MRIRTIIVRMPRMLVSGIRKALEARTHAKPDITDYIEAKLTYAQQVERELP